MLTLLSKITYEHLLTISRAFLEAIVPEVKLEAGLASQVIIVFLRQLLYQYHKWISSPAPRSEKLESLHVHGGEEGVLDDVSHLVDCIRIMH